MNADLDLKNLIGSDYTSQVTDSILDELMISINNFQMDNSVKGTGNIFDCAISLGDFDFNLDLDFFKINPSRMDYILLKKIQYLRRMIIEINNIFINLIQDLECCTGDDRYNRTVVPIFKWLVEDPNGLCGTLLKISKDINKIYIPLKRVLCLFRNIPGNPTIGMAGTDLLKFIYPVVEGLEKVTNMLDNGRFLDIIIVPVKDFHDKLVACHNGTDVDFYSGYTSLKDIISSSIFNELNLNLIDEIKKVQEENISDKTDLPIPPIAPEINYEVPIPKLNEYSTYDEFSADLYEWNVGYSEYKKDLDREYNIQYSEYLLRVNEYKQKKFEKTLNINDEKFSNSTFSVELSTDDFKTKHRSICGCLGEIFRLDGYFVPKDFIIRSEADLNDLLGEVEYKGVNSSNYYMDPEERKIKIISAVNINDIKKLPFETSFNETMKYPVVKDEFLQQIGTSKTIEEVVNLNSKFTKELNSFRYDFRKKINYYDSLGTSFYSIYLNELEQFRREQALYKNGVETTPEKIDELNKQLYSYAEYPPSSWIAEDKELTPNYKAIFGNITYTEYLVGIDQLEELTSKIKDYEDAIGRNHAVFKIVDESIIECGCDLLCMVIKYIIGLIMELLKKLISYITSFISNSVMNKEMQWWIKFVMDKVKCIIDILNISKDLEKMEKAFNDEMKRGENSIRKAPESVSNCSSSSKSIIEELNVFPDKAKVQPDSIKDITWIPDVYPNMVLPTDVTPVLDNSFKLITDKVEFKSTSWKNRTIPTMLLDCSQDFSAGVNWEPNTNSWKAFLNVELNIEQFNSNFGITLNGVNPISDEEVIDNLYKTILFNILDTGLKTENFKIKILLDSTEHIILTKNLEYTLSDTLIIKNPLPGKNLLLDNIDKVWFWVEAVDSNGIDISNYVKVYDKHQVSTLSEFKDNIVMELANTLDKFKQTEFPEEETESPTSNKLCGANSLSVTIFEPITLISSIDYPGEVLRVVSEVGEVNFVYRPKLYTKSDGTTYYYVGNNTPFKLTMINGSGVEFTVVLLIDVCLPGLVQNTTYSKETSGLFLNGRYDHIDFIAIPNDNEFVITEKDIIKRLRGYLESVGAVSSSYTGPLGLGSTLPNSSIIIPSDEIPEDIYSDGFDTTKIDTSNVGKSNLINIPAGVTKSTILTFEKLSENIANILDEVKIIEDLVTEFNPEIMVINETPQGIKRTPQKLGIPLLVLNEEHNIILTIHEKKLKLININSNFGLDVVLETTEIDYKDGEQLFIEFSTTGFEHTISWTNERKIKNTSSIMSLNTLSLKPTQLGSFYKDGQKVALMCGKINDIIFTNSNRTVDEWFNNSNTYRPNGTIGFYDFSLFDGYHVYSVPEFFKVVKLNSLATVKGILYESKQYNSIEIAKKIQDGKFNELLSSEVTIVGEKPISVGGDFIWKNNVYYKNVSFGYLENFFCRDNLAGESFTISFWLKQKDAITNLRENFNKKYIFSDTNFGNFIWLEDDLLKIQLFNQPLRIEPIKLLFTKDITSVEPEYIEKWFHHVFKFDKADATVYYTINCIDRKRNFDQNYSIDILEPKTIKIPLIGKEKVLDFSLVTMLARYDVKKLDYTDNFFGEITALSIWNKFLPLSKIESLYDYQRRIIINEM